MEHRRLIADLIVYLYIVKCKTASIKQYSSTSLTAFKFSHGHPYIHTFNSPFAQLNTRKIFFPSRVILWVGNP